MSTTIAFSGEQDLIAEAEKNGFFTVPGFFKPEIVQRLRGQMEALLDEDEARRDDAKQPISLTEDGFMSDYTEYMHNYLFPVFRNELLALMICETMECGPIRKFMEYLAGPDWRLRVDLVRRSTGAVDVIDEVQLPHAWHRDSPGEFTFGFFIDDMSGHDVGGTAVVPGTHWSAIDPNWELMIGPNVFISRQQYESGNYDMFPAAYLERAEKSGEFVRTALNRAVEIKGGAGDLFFFINNVFHGRWPNKSEKRKMLVRFGGFSSAFPFLDNLTVPVAKHALSERLNKLYAPRQQTEWSNEILLCKMIDHPRDDAITLAAAEEKSGLVEEYLASQKVA